MSFPSGAPPAGQNGTTQGYTPSTNGLSTQRTLFGLSIPPDSHIRNAIRDEFGRNPEEVEARVLRAAAYERQRRLEVETAHTYTSGTHMHPAGTVTDPTSRMPGTFLPESATAPGTMPYSSISPLQSGHTTPPSTFGWKTAAACTVTALGTAAYYFGTTGLPSEADSIIMSGINVIGDTTCSVVPAVVRGGISMASAAASTVGGWFGGASEMGAGTVAGLSNVGQSFSDVGAQSVVIISEV